MGGRVVVVVLLTHDCERWSREQRRSWLRMSRCATLEPSCERTKVSKWSILLSPDSSSWVIGQEAGD